MIVNGYGLSETHFGGYAEKARVKGDWLVKLPPALTRAEAMAIGTAGYTAMLCVMALERHGLTPAAGPVLVTGAAGGVGSIAISLLAAKGWKVIASTGRASEADYLKSLGAAEIIDRATLSAPGKPLGKEQWAAAVDSVGSTTLANVLAQTRYGGAVAACGLAGGMDLPATVAPFILRSVALLGVDSVQRPMPDRLEAWGRLGERPRSRQARRDYPDNPVRRSLRGGAQDPQGRNSWPGGRHDRLRRRPPAESAAALFRFQARRDCQYTSKGLHTTPKPGCDWFA